MNAFCHVAQAWAAWELRSKSITKPTRRDYAQVLLESLEKGWQEAAETHAEIVAQQKLWTTWILRRAQDERTR